MSKRPGVNEIREQLDRLREALRNFAEREERIENEYQVRSNGEAKAYKAAREKQETEAAEALAIAESDLETAKAGAEAHFQKRKASLHKIYQTVREKGVEAVGLQEGKRKHRLQEASLEAERKRTAGLAEAAAFVENLHTDLTETRGEFVGLEIQARKAFRGYGAFRRMLSPTKTWPATPMSSDATQLLEELHKLLGRTRDDLAKFKQNLLPQVFRFVPPWLIFILAAGVLAASVWAPSAIGMRPITLQQAGIIFGAIVVVVMVIHTIGRTGASKAATALASDLALARRLHDACLERADVWHQETQAKLKGDLESKQRSLDQEWKQIVKEGAGLRSDRREAIDQKGVRLQKKNEDLHSMRIARIERDSTELISELRTKATAALKQLDAGHAERMGKFKADHDASWQKLSEECRTTIQPLLDSIQSADKAAAELFPAWNDPAWQNWKPAETFSNTAKFGRLEVDLARLADIAPRDQRVALPLPKTLTAPLQLIYPQAGSILFETGKTGGEEAIAAINNIIFRLLSTNPAAKLSFTIFDPVGLGQNFAGLMHLADYEEGNINSRIWTQTAQIEEKLAELNDHMEKVIQMYLRNEYPTIAEYNAQAGSIAEKYHFLVVASFPVNFSDVAGRRLINIASSGARCGVYTLINWDQRQALPQGLVPDELRKHSVTLTHTERGFEMTGRQTPGVKLVLDPPPPADLATSLLHQVGEASKGSNRVEVPFEQIAPPRGELWQEETTEELEVPIGRSGATKLQYLAIGRATRQHALIAGKTGSGKSTLFHVIITNLALRCSPDQVEFYLVDFKKGVEFKCYGARRLPHARVVAIESDRAFGLSVLQKVDAELRRRGDLFRARGAQDLPGYKRAGGTEPMPRSLLMIDEFQEFFVEEDSISQNAAVLLDRIVRQGRAFGIHVLLGSQTLGGAYTLARATIGQMVIRIALQCNEADAYLIMDQDNPAPRLLTRPGEGIYNDTAGSIEGNSPFQTVWLSEPVRDRLLQDVRAKADAQPGRYPPPFVFEGNAPASVEDCEPLREVLAAENVKVSPTTRVWLGSPNSIKGPTEAAFQRMSGNNLIVVGQNEEAALTMLCLAMISLSAQHPRGQVSFVVCDSSAPGSPQREFFERVIKACPHPVTLVNNSNVGEVLGGLAADLKRRDEASAASTPETYLLVFGLQNWKKLRQEDEFSFSSTESEEVSASASFLKLISDGPAHGIHTLATCDTYNNVTRCLGRKNLSEFEMRVLFQMSPGDSASLIDNPDAGTLGLHRALLYNDREGTIETFRPYSLPGNDWLDHASQDLKRLIAEGQPAVAR